MNDDEATRLLDRAAEALIPDEPAPLASLLVAARRDHRTRSRRAIALAAASVALVLGGGTVVQQVVGDDSDRPSLDLNADVPSAPAGTRLVGMGRVVIAVPSSWGTQAVHCGLPVRDTVYFAARANLCRGTSHRDVASVAILDATSDAARLAVDMARTEEDVNGLAVMRGRADCPSDADCDYAYEEVLWVPAHDVVFAVPPGGDDEGVLDSVQLLPDGYTTVPFIEPGQEATQAFSAMAGADLLDRTQRLGFNGYEPDGFDPSGEFFRTSDPQAGSVVSPDQVVTLTMTDSRREALFPTTGYAPNLSMTVTPATARPGDMVALTFQTEHRRGLAFTLRSAASQDPSPAFWLTSDRGQAPPSWSAQPQPVHQIAIQGPGPDHVVIPDAAAGGDYLLCTADEADQVCASVRVVAADHIGSPANYRLAVGDTADLTVPTHCGIRYALIDGEMWQTPASDRGSAPDPLMVGRAYRAGQDRVEFEHPSLVEPLVFEPAPSGTEWPGCF